MNYSHTRLLSLLPNISDAEDVARGNSNSYHSLPSKDDAQIIRRGTLVLDGAAVVLPERFRTITNHEYDAVRPSPGEDTAELIQLKSGRFLAVKTQETHKWTSRWGEGSRPEIALTMMMETDPLDESMLVKFMTPERGPLHGNMMVADGTSWQQIDISVPYPVNGLMVCTQPLIPCDVGLHATSMMDSHHWMGGCGTIVERVRILGRTIRCENKTVSQIMEFGYNPMSFSIGKSHIYIDQEWASPERIRSHFAPMNHEICQAFAQRYVREFIIHASGTTRWCDYHGFDMAMTQQLTNDRVLLLEMALVNRMKGEEGFLQSAMWDELRRVFDLAKNAYWSDDFVKASGDFYSFVTRCAVIK
jgi:hypothetical protein